MDAAGASRSRTHRALEPPPEARSEAEAEAAEAEVTGPLALSQQEADRPGVGDPLPPT